MLSLKQKGYSDLQLGYLTNSTEDEVYYFRKALGIKRTYKLVDTCAAEFEALTPYFYSSFEAMPAVAEDKKYFAEQHLFNKLKNFLLLITVTHLAHRP